MESGVTCSVDGAWGLGYSVMLDGGCMKRIKDGVASEVEGVVDGGVEVEGGVKSGYGWWSR